MTSRRSFLQASAAVAAATALPAIASAQKTLATELKEQLLKYLESNAKPDGGYGWDGQDHSHLTPTFAIIGCYHLLGIQPPNKATLAQFVRTHHPRELKKLEREQRQFDWQQIQSLVWLGEDVTSFRDLVTSWKEPKPYSKQYEQHGYPVFQQEISPILCRKLLGLPMAETPAAFIDYVHSRRRKNGTFNNTPSDDNTDGHVLNTWWGLQALAAIDPKLDSLAALKEDTIVWLRNCQLSRSGLSYQPPSPPSAEEAELQKKLAREPRLAGKAYLAISLAGLGRGSGPPGYWADIAYTWAAVRSLKLLGAEVKIVNTQFAESQPEDPLADFLRSIHNSDGGFGDLPGWLSNPLATYFALDTLSALGFINTLPVPKPPFRSPPPPSRQPDLKVFSLQLEAHGQGSPADAVELADALNIHLWGAKNAKPQWLARAQQLASQQGIAVKFFSAREGYGDWVNVPGMGTYSHMTDAMGPANATDALPFRDNKNLTWSDLKYSQRVSLADSPSSRLFWQFGENEPLVRMLLDDSIRGTNIVNTGYAAISTFHFSNPDFTNTEPFLMRYHGQIPFVSLQDAHGPEPWWFADMTTGFRTLLLAEQPTWDGWLEALRYNRVVAVRHDAVSGGKTWMHGLPEVVEVVREQWKSWQWWDNPSIERPLVSVVAIKPNDEFETGRPESGIAIRVRCARENTTQGLPKAPLAEFVRLSIDGEPVEPQLVERRRPNGVLEDAYHLYNWPDAPLGRHRAAATIRRPNSDQTTSRSLTFNI